MPLQKIRTQSLKIDLRSLVVAMAVSSLVLAACGAGGATTDASGPAADGVTTDGATTDGASAGTEEVGGSELEIVATTAVMGDLVRTVVGERATVEVLMEGNVDPHTFAMSAQQRGELGAADLVVANGLGLEAGIQAVLDQVAAEGVEVLEVATFLDPIESGVVDHDESGDHPDDDTRDDTHDDDHDDDHEAHDVGDGHEHGPLDPHVWLDPVRMAHAGEVLADRLDDIAEGPWHDGAEAWDDTMLATHDTVSEILAPVPEACRLMVTEHDSLAYFAQRYDFEVVGTIVPGLSTDAEPSAGDLAALADTLAETGAIAIFVENTASTRAADALAAGFAGAVSVQPVPVATVGVDELETGSDLLVELATRVAEPLVDCDA